MGSETEVVDKILKSFLSQLRIEFGILDRIVFENKNQHWRSSYFRFLQKMVESMLKQLCLDSTVSSLSQKKRSIKISEGDAEGILSTERSPTHPPDPECILQKDKFVLVEIINRTETQSLGQDLVEVVPSTASTVQYRSIEVLLGDNESGMATPEHARESPDDRKTDSGSLARPFRPCNEEQAKDGSPAAESPTPLDCSTAPEGGSLETSSSSLHPNPLKCKYASKGKVTFVSVKVSTPSRATKLDSCSKGAEKVDEKQREDEDPFFSMLTGGGMKKSI